VADWRIMMTEINNKTSSSFDETIDRISACAAQTRTIGIELLRSIYVAIEENIDTSSQEAVENSEYSKRIKECLDTIYQERFGNKRRCRSKNIFKMFLTLVCHNANYDIWGNKFSQFKMTYYNAYMRYIDLSEDEKKAASSVQKLADEYKNPHKHKREDSSPKTLKECLTDFLKRHKEMMSEATEPMTITLGNVTYTLSILSENSE
jgi:hypothetical protein